MTKIVNKAKCNIIESGNMNSGSFLGDLLVCPTYEEIINLDKFNVSGTYENNQLVKESDITKYIGKIKNYSFIWGEWDMTKKNDQMSAINRICNVNIKQNFLNAPDTNLTITITLKLVYKNNPASDVVSSVTKNVTVNFTQTTGNDKKYAYTQDFAIKFGQNTKATMVSMEIINVTITPNSTSQYEYITNIKDVTQNYFVKTLSVATTRFYINSYNDDASEKIISGTYEITPHFNIPTGTSINDISVGIDEYNFSIGTSIGLTYNTSFNDIAYKFRVDDLYGERGYKLPYFYIKLAIRHKPSSNTSYVHALWNPASTNTGIELSSLITEE